MAWFNELSPVPWFRPYTKFPGQENPATGKPRKNGITSKQLREAKGIPGVYLITMGEKMLYVGKTESDLYTIITRKFQDHRDTDYRRFTLNPENPKIYVSYIPMKGRSASQIANAENALIKKYKPKHNKAGRFPGIQNHFVTQHMIKKAGVAAEQIAEELKTSYDDGEDLPF